MYARSQIELKAEDLYDKEKVDLETVRIDDVFTLLQCDDQGLTSEETARRLAIFGPNKLESEEQNAFLQVHSRYSSFFLIYSNMSFFCSVPLLHVEPLVVGHGGCCARRHCPLKWWW